MSCKSIHCFIKDILIILLCFQTISIINNNDNTIIAIQAVPTLIGFLPRDAIQSSTLSIETPASNAIDFNTDGQAVFDSFTSTQRQTNPYIQLDMQDYQCVISVTVRNSPFSTPGDKERLTGFQVWTATKRYINTSCQSVDSQRRFRIQIERLSCLAR
jgi:hypothetical protein